MPAQLRELEAVLEEGPAAQGWEDQCWTLAGGKRTAADLGAWICFKDESGQGLRPPKGRTAAVGVGAVVAGIVSL
jgi:hypothetical protein